MRLGTRVRANARGLCAPPTGWPPPAAAGAKWPCAALRVPGEYQPGPPFLRLAAESIRTVGGARSLAPGTGLPSRSSIFCFPGPPPPPPAGSAPGRRLEAAPPGPAGEGGRAAGRAPPLPCRPRPGAPLGFSMTASGRGPPLFPPSLRAGPPLPCAPGFFQGSTGAWRRRVLPPGRGAPPPPPPA